MSVIPATNNGQHLGGDQRITESPCRTSHRNGIKNLCSRESARTAELGLGRYRPRYAAATFSVSGFWDYRSRIADHFRTFVVGTPSLRWKLFAEALTFIYCVLFAGLAVYTAHVVGELEYERARADANAAQLMQLMENTPSPPEEQIVAWEQGGGWTCADLQTFIKNNWCSLTESQRDRVRALAANHNPPCHPVYPTCN